MSEQTSSARRLISVGIITLVLRVITLVSKLLLTLAMARMLSTADVGSYGLAVAILSIATVAVGMELYTQGNRELVGLTSFDQVHIIRDQFILYGVTYLAATVVLIGAVLMDVVSLAFGGIVLGLLILDHFSQECFRVLIYLTRTVWANLVLFFRAGAWAYVVIAAMFAYPSSRSVEFVFLLWAIGALTSIILAGFAIRDLPWARVMETKISWKWIGASFLAARPFMITAVAALVSIYVDRFFLEYYAGRESVGVYTVLSGFSLAILSLVTAAVSQQFLPRLVAAASRSKAQMIGSLKAFLLVNLAFTAAISIAALIAIRPLLTIIGKPEYLSDVSVFTILVAAMVFRAVADVPAGALYAARADNHLMASNLTTVMAVLIFDALLIPSWGISGASWAALGASMILLGVHTILATRAVKGLPDLQPEILDNPQYRA